MLCYFPQQGKLIHYEGHFKLYEPVEIVGKGAGGNKNVISFNLEGFNDT